MITIKYRVGSGTAGNVLAETITVMRDIAADIHGNRVAVSVTNYAQASGGAEAESADHIRSWAPRYFETQERCVTQADYETTAMMFRDEDAGAIAKARAVVCERSGEANVIRYYVLSYAEDLDKLALASQPLKDALLAYVNQRKMLTDYVEIQDGTWRLVDVEGTLRITPGFNAGMVIERVEESLRSLMNAGNTQMGGKLRISDVYAAIDNTEGVESVELQTPTSTVTADPNEALLFGNMEFTVEGSVSDGTNN
jgi:phage-related baseplate assembly protein